MKEMDAGTLLRFTGTCKTLMKLGDDHPEFFRRFISKKHDKKFAMSVPRKDLRNETLALVKLDPNDPLVCRIAKEKEEEKRAKEEAMKGKMKTKVGPRYVANPSMKGARDSNVFSETVFYVNGDRIRFVYNEVTDAYDMVHLDGNN